MTAAVQVTGLPTAGILKPLQQGCSTDWRHICEVPSPPLLTWHRRCKEATDSNRRLCLQEQRTSWGILLLWDKRRAGGGKKGARNFHLQNASGPEDLHMSSHLISRTPARGVAIMAQQKRIQLVSVRMWVQSLAPAQ